MTSEKAAKGYLWAKPNDSRGRVCGIYQVSHGAGEHGSQVGMERNVQRGKRQVCVNHKGARVIKSPPKRCFIGSLSLLIT